VLNQVANGGVAGNNYNVTSTYVTGGGFSLDGVHPSPRGYGLIANKFISNKCNPWFEPKGAL
jgi:lysophospholipase L1-like esterase